MSALERLHVSKRLRRSLFGLLTFVVLLLVVLQGFGLRPLFGIQKAFVAAGTAVGNTLVFIRRYDEFQRELASLREKLLQVTREAAEVERLEQENRELTSLLDFAQGKGKGLDLLSAHVLSRSLREERAHVTIDVGRDSGVKEGAAVLVEDGVLVGTVIRATDQFSVVRLITDERSRTSARLLGSETIGVAEGTRGSVLAFSFIPQHVALELQDLVLTSGMEEGVPSGLVIGFVSEVREDDTQPFKSALIEPLVDPRLYRTLAVVRTPVAL